MNYENELHKALVGAFTLEGLERMLRYQMGLELESISRAGDKEAVVATLVRTAGREGWLFGLIQAAYQANPGNERLQFLLRSPQIQKMLKTEPQGVRVVAPSAVNQSVEDRVTEIEFLLGTRGFNGLMRKVQSNEDRLIRIEEALAVRGNTPVGPRAAQVIMMVILALTALASAKPAWDIAMLIWRWFGGG
ncbi:MAG: hypothetical protein KDE54_00475 [Caldilineaceae bacterium]|nr:hypothetical protein [Caldilineaceae bacterium]MCB0143834.1 hypothetical protein [Caldilineaceae bacterium]